MSNIIGPDVSFYQDNADTARQIDFNVMRGATNFVIIRAGQNNWVDPDFAYNWKQSKAAGLSRGSYWYYDSRAEPIAQAELWFAQFKGDLGELPLFADFEERYGGSYGGWLNFKIFLERIKKLAITKEIAIYTGYYYWKELNIPDTAIGYFKQFPLWIAAYRSLPPQIPEPWTTWLFWQYTDKGNGASYGVESTSIDLNYFNGDLNAFNERFGLSGPASRPLDVESHTMPFDGVVLHRVFRYGSWCSIAIIDPTAKKFHVTPFKMRTTSQAAKDLGSQITINGGAHTPTQAIGIHVSEGNLLALQHEYEPYCNFTVDQKPQMKYYNSADQKWNALAGKRMIVEGGKISQNTSAAWSEVHPRTLIGVGYDGQSILCTVDGRQSPHSVGVDLYNAAKIMIEFGCVLATDLDGGGSTTMVIQQPDGSQKVVNYPIDNGVVGKERIVGDHIAVFMNDGGNMVNEAQIPTHKAVNNSANAVNLKPQDGTGSVVALPPGGWVYGIRPTGTDIMEVCHNSTREFGYFVKTGEFKPLSEKFKVFTGTLTVTPYTYVPPIDPDPDPDPDPVPAECKIKIDQNGNRTVLVTAKNTVIDVTDDVVVTVLVNGVKYVKA